MSTPTSSDPTGAAQSGESPGSDGATSARPDLAGRVVTARLRSARLSSARRVGLVTTSRMRWHVMVQPAVSFFYNAAVVAFALSPIAGR